MSNEQYDTFDQLAHIVLSAKPFSPYLVGINGKDASGKTVFANNFADYLRTRTNRQIIRISIDDFMNQRKVRRTPTSSKGETCYRYTFNFNAIKQCVLEPLVLGGSRIYKTKVFDYATDKAVFSNDKKADDDAIVIIDGVFLFKDDLIPYWSLKVLLEVADNIIIERGVARDSKRIGSYKKARELYVERYIVSQEIYYEQANPLERADVVINNDNYFTPKVTRSISN